MEGGNMLFLPTFSNNDPSYACGESQAQKLLHAGSSVAIYQEDVVSGPGSFAVNAVLGGGVGRAMIDRNPNPLQVYAIIEQAIMGEDGWPTSVDVLLPASYREEWGHIMRQTAVSSSSDGLAANLAVFGYNQALAEANRGQYHRANVDVSRVVAHARWRNVFLTSTLGDVVRDLAMLWPAPVTASEFDFVEAASGASLGEAARRTSLRSLCDGEVGLRVGGEPVAVLDPTRCLPRGIFG